MASSSTSSIQRSFKYDVFLSFRGEDTRKNFVDHLYAALRRQGIHTYKDDERIEKGKRISDELIKSIEDSKFFIIIFSKNYTSSSWCLKELVKIMECHRTTEHTAYPVFYDVEPSEVRKQSGEVGEAFDRHKVEEAAGKWREALEDASNLAGWELKNTTDGHEAKFIQKIVEEILLELRSINMSINENLVGMERRMIDVESLLNFSSDVCMIGITGIGGGGKTTLARAVFDKISFQFDGNSFVENIREVSKGSLPGLKSLQEKALSDILNEKDINLRSVHDGKIMMKKRLHGMKVIVVLDDVDHIDQLEALAGESNWFKPGSRIIITTRDEQVLVAHQVNLILNVNLLSDEEAIWLFSRYAFGRSIPIQGYQELSRQVVRYAAGLPLTIRVLGSFLCGKTDLEWKDALERLKTIPLKETLEKLELSYIGLEQDYKEIFLDIACILKGERKDDAIRILESCGFHARNGLRVLEQKSLITIDNEELDMHDHIEEMGRNIVRREYPDEPRKHSRLWVREEIEDILAADLGTKATRYIRVRLEGFSPEIFMKGLVRMKKLKVLHVDSENVGDCFSSNSIYDEAGHYFSNALQYLKWVGYPYRFLPKTFRANNLVTLEMPYSNIVHLWEGEERKVLNNLRYLDLSYSKLMKHDLGSTLNLVTLNLEGCHNLVKLGMPDGCLKLRSLNLCSSKLRTLDLRRTPKLENLCLKGCHGLVDIHMPTGGSELTYLNLNSSKLKILDLRLTSKLEKVHLTECHDLVELNLPINGCLKLIDIKLTGTKLSNLDFCLTPNLIKLCLEECDELVELYMPTELKSVNLNLSKLKTLDLRLASKLVALNLEECYDLVEIHMPIKGCLNLTHLNLKCAKLCKIDLRLTPNLEILCLEECEELVELQMPVKLRSIELNHSKMKTLDLRLTSKLTWLTLYKCHNLVEIIMPINPHLKITHVNVTCSKLRTFDLRLTPNLEMLRLEDCGDFRELYMPINGCKKLMYLQINGSKLRTLDLRLSPNLQMLCLTESDELVELHIPIKIKSVDLNHSKLKTVDLGLMSKLETLTLIKCHDLEDLHLPINGCLNLTDLQIGSSKLRTLDLSLTPNLEILRLKECDELVELHMPAGFPQLTSLNLNRSKLKTLDLRLTPSLEMLHLKECSELVDLHMPAGCLKELAFLDFSGCSGFKSFVLTKQAESPEVHLSTESLDIRSLDSNHSLPKFRFSCVYEAQPSSSTINLEKLISLGLSRCPNLNSFIESICGLPSLRKLKLYDSIPKVGIFVNLSEGIENQILFPTEIRHFLDEICKLKHLESLRLESIWHLEKLPEDLGRLEYLEELSLSDLHINHLPDSICVLKHLKSLTLESCWLLQKLPEDLGQLQNLENLVLIDCVIKRSSDEYL